MKNYAIILASGTGERAKAHLPKQFIKVASKTLLEHTIEIFERNELIDKIIIVTSALYHSLTEEIILKNHYQKVCKILNGGETRSESSRIGVNSIEEEDSAVLIHDAVRPFLSQQIINNCIKALEKFDAVDVAIPSADTIIKVNDTMIIDEIPNRKMMMRGQTPQAFKLWLIKKAHLLAAQNGEREVTDDCGLIVKYNLGKVHVVYGEEENIKITYPEDIFLADKLFQIRSLSVPEQISLSKLKNKVIVVFGASRGIGKAIIDIAKDYGAKIYGFSRQDNVDVTSIRQVNQALEKVHLIEGKIDSVVNTAGVLRMGKLESRDIQDILEEININYIGSINVTKAAIPFLKATKGSLLLYTSSSYTRGRALYSIYSSTKAAIVNLVQGMSEELLSDEIRINVINPERTATPMRTENFGKEPPETLLPVDKVAEDSLKVLLSDLRGQVIDVRKDS